MTGFVSGWGRPRWVTDSVPAGEPALRAALALAFVADGPISVVVEERIGPWVHHRVTIKDGKVVFNQTVYLGDDGGHSVYPGYYTRVPCPYCGAEVDNACRTKSCKPTHVHCARTYSYFRAFPRESAERRNQRR